MVSMFLGASLVYVATGTPLWSTLLVAVLSSSAISAIATGVATTQLRGQIERDEAWRTRLVETSEEFLAQLDGALAAVSFEWLMSLDGEDESLQSDGHLTPAAAAAVAALEAANNNLLPLLARVQLLLDPIAVAHAGCAVRNLTNAASLLAGSQWIAEEISQHGAENLEIAAEHSLSQDDFDPEDDSSVGTWTCLLLESVGGHRKAFIDACVERINSKNPSHFDLKAVRARQAERERRPTAGSR